MSETAEQKRAMLALSKTGRIFRNNVGVAVYQVEGQQPRRVRYGLCPGSSDLIGWTRVKITPEMIGSEVAVFTAIEMKSKTGTAGREQRNFRDQVLSAGGVSGIARSGEEAAGIVAAFKAGLSSPSSSGK